MKIHVVVQKIIKRLKNDYDKNQLKLFFSKIYCYDLN